MLRSPPMGVLVAKLLLLIPLLTALVLSPVSASGQSAGEDAEPPAEQPAGDSQSTDETPRAFDPEQAREMVRDPADIEEQPAVVSAAQAETDAQAEAERVRLPLYILGATFGLHAAFVGMHLLLSDGNIEGTYLYAYPIMLPVDVVVGTLIGNSDHWQVHWGWMLLGSVLGNGVGFGLSLGCVVLDTVPSAAAGGWTFWILASVVLPTVIPALASMVTYILARKRRDRVAETTSARVRYLPPGPAMIALPGPELGSIRRTVLGVSLGTLAF